MHLRDENGGIVAASQDALGLAGGEFVVLLDHDDVLADGALARVAEAADATPDLDYLYSDQDRMTFEGETHSRFRKPDWSPERLLHHNYVTHLSVLRRDLAVDVGGFRTGYDGSQDHDLVLRVAERARRVVHVPEVLYHWREVPGSASATPRRSRGHGTPGSAQSRTTSTGSGSEPSRARAGCRAPTTSSASPT